MHELALSYFASFYRKLWSSVPSQLLILLCFGYLGIYVMYIVAFYSTAVPALCVVSGAILHYFMLATFILMAAEAINLFNKLVLVFTRVEKFVTKAAITAWGRWHMNTALCLVLMFCFSTCGFFSHPQLDTAAACNCIGSLLF